VLVARLKRKYAIYDIFSFSNESWLIDSCNKASSIGLNATIPPAKSATELASDIVRFYQQHNSTTSNDMSTSDKQPIRKLLFLCGDRRLDDLPNTLKIHDDLISLKELVVYKTSLNQSLDELRDLLNRADPTQLWLCFFSPSGVEALFEQKLIPIDRISRRSDHQDESDCVHIDCTDQNSNGASIKLAAIGQTTATAVRSHYGVCHAIAKQPCATGLYEAISHFDLHQTASWYFCCITEPTACWT